MVFTTAHGQKVQVDDGGDELMARNPNTVKCKRARLLVLTPGYSRKYIQLLS